LAPAPSGAHASNLACALGVATALGVDETALRDRVGGVSEPEHRRTVARGQRGVAIIDDTFNSNPAGARAALSTLARLGAGGRKVVVTPGMVELGTRQQEENRLFAADAAAVSDLIIVVGRTNRPALVAGARDGGGEVRDV